MPDVNDGLSTGPAPDINTEAGFEAAMASKGLDPEEGSAPSDTSVANGLTTTEPATQRDDQGRFTPKEDAPAAPASADTSDEPQVDPAVAEYLAKYNGDAAAALKAAAEAQSVIGRQGQELGRTREEMAELRGQLNALAAMQQATPTGPVLSQDQVEERAVDMSATQGYQAAATTLANEALNGDSRTYDVLLRNWALEDPIGAQRFDLDFQLWKRDEAAKANVPEVDPRLNDVLGQQEINEMGAAIGTVAQERGEAWASIAPHMDAALEQVHPSILELVASRNPEDRLAGTRMIADKATLLSLSAPVQAQTPEQVAAQAAEARKLAGSQVASGSLRPAAEQNPASTREDALAEFKRQIVESDSTRVIDGLTFGT